MTVYKQSICSRGLQLSMEGYPPHRILAMQCNHTTPQEWRLPLNLFDWGKGRDIHKRQVRESVGTKLIENLLVVCGIVVVTRDWMRSSKPSTVSRMSLNTRWRAARCLSRTAEPRIRQRSARARRRGIRRSVWLSSLAREQGGEFIQSALQLRRLCSD